MRLTNKIQDEINSKYLETYLQETGRPTGKGETFLCIVHNDTNPSMFYFRDSKESNKKAFCRSCHKLANIFDFVKYDEGLQTKQDQFKFLCERYNIENPEELEIEEPKEEPPEEEVKLQEELFPDNMIEALEKAQSNEYLHKQLAINLLSKRGITEKTIQKYKLTITMKMNETMSEPMKTQNENLSKFVGGGIIFPFIDSQNRFTYLIQQPLAKTIKSNNPKAKQLEKYYKPKGQSILFNERYLQDKSKEVIFITEGIFDSLSIEEIDFKSIALLTTNQKRFFKLLEKLDPKEKVFVLLLDNDSSGEEGERILCEYMKKNNFKFISHNQFKDTSQIEWKDSNEYLIKDKEQFTKYIQMLYKEGEKMNQNELDSLNAYKNIDSFFETTMKETFKPIPTGFNKLDETLGGGLLNQSIVTIGGASSIGKTTFVINLSMKQLKNRPVIYYTLENSKEQILSKFFSHIAFINGGRVFSSTTLLQSYDTDKMTEKQREDTLQILKDTEELKNLLVLNPEEATLQEMEKTINQIALKYKEEGKASPVIVLDYIQFLQSNNSRDDEMNIVKKTQRILKKYVIDNNSIAFLLVANNRQGNQEKQSRIDSGRGTSDLEYSSDYNFQLNYSEWEHNPNSTKTAKELRGMNPKQISLTIQKNRLGESGRTIDFTFNGISNTFTETKPSEENIYSRRSSRERTFNEL